MLNFHGRVTKSSVKNFQLCVENNWYNTNTNNITNSINDDEDCDYNLNNNNYSDANDVTLQFGKFDTDKFTMDVRYPMSIYQAYAICIACMDGKIADRRGYEYIKKLTGMGSSDNPNSNGDEREAEEKVS